MEREKTNLELHAEREMRLAGLYDDDSDYGGMIPDAVLAMVKAHSDQGHSGGSHAVTMSVFDKVVRFKTLTPIDNNPEHWMDVSEMSGTPMWQSTRDPSYFSTDGGKTWYNLDEQESHERTERA